MLVAFGAEVPGRQEVGPRPGHGGHRGQGCAGPIGSGQPGNTGLASPRLTKHSHISLYKYCFSFYKLRPGAARAKQVCSHILPGVCAHCVSLCHIFIILMISQTLSLLLYLHGDS